jgi:hypothetical protein
MTPEVESQLNKLENSSLELEKRRIAVYTLIDGKLSPIINGSDKSTSFLNKKIDNFAPTPNAKLYLIGLDKGIKKTFSSDADPKQIFEIVDSMPMRRAEMRNN